MGMRAGARETSEGVEERWDGLTWLQRARALPGLGETSRG